uniref:ATP-dependent RNA helicase n=1 Tax=Trypanosoma vivax (strain Y486) TaxID=1055687 RepID=G0TW22_TRYVY|nr:putative helicase, fragment [Trypanosoma vivax Y486]
MSSSDIAVKRLRRQWEPEEKTWNDEALQQPWEDITPPLQKVTIFALRNVFFFSHATAVQSHTINVFCNSGNSVIVEAPTGSGKTLAVLIPLVERTMRACNAYVAENNRPLLRRDVIGVILSPSRVLAEQTFVVGRNIAARLPHTIRFVLCDGAVQSHTALLDSLRKAARGAGVFLVTTPHDLVDFIAAWKGGQSLLASSSSTSAGVEQGSGCDGGAEDGATGEMGERQQLLAAQDEETQLQNRYLVCEAHDFLSLLIQLMNMHASKKHFIFFNSPKTLKFVEKLFTRLSEGDRMLLCINRIFVMYEGMNERTRLEQYNAFLNHNPRNHGRSGAVKKSSNTMSQADKNNQFYTSGWKREGRQPEGRGAILLCTNMAAFGLDVRDVDYVYHFEPPVSVQSYVHRIGRVGRMGMRGSSILILPCISSGGSLEVARERKTTSLRYNTLTNTKSSTLGLQSSHVSEEDLSKDQQQYLKELGSRGELQPLIVPPFAPIASTIRTAITQNSKLTSLAQTAAMSMCTVPSDASDHGSWFYPKLALCALLLD